jgi:hypothetical protein
LGTTKWPTKARLPTKKVKQTPAAEDSDPDQAWMVLKLVNEWVRYADAKIAITFTFIGVTAGALYNLIKSHTPLTIAMAVACGGMRCSDHRVWDLRRYCTVPEDQRQARG